MTAGIYPGPYSEAIGSQMIVTRAFMVFPV
jgi:hypothetical protein